VPGAATTPRRVVVADGSRLMRRRLLSPLKDVARIRRRLDMVEVFVIHSALRESLRRPEGRAGKPVRAGSAVCCA